MPELSGIERLPLPGGADLGNHPYEVTAEFEDVLSLVPQSAVKVNDVAVGRVTRITLSSGDWSAKVTMRINGDVKLPADAYAHLEQSSLLGEKYIQLSPPPANSRAAAGTQAAGTRAADPLADGAAIPIARTNRNPEVEEVFGALSLLLNGGGINQIKTIATELNKALGGREPHVASLLKRIDTLVTSLDKNKGNITAALDGVNRLAATLATRKQQVGKVLTGLSPGLSVLEQQRGSLLTMLRALGTLSGVAVDTVKRSKADTIADLKALGPTLKALADSGRALPDSLQVLVTYPFTDEVLRGVKGDYLNVYLNVAAVPGTQIIPELTPPGAQAQAGRGAALPLPLPPVTTDPATRKPASTDPASTEPAPDAATTAEGSR
ncbi:MCE family protein [Streptomyces sp. NPDC051098]|uniref:MCE family protein n=1 Tax=Streptomyces sp. NPDC051098 TaxID=3155411 RepID=UPI00341258BB